jgi:hypothetical protein
MRYPIEYTLCQPCACGVANDDWSHISYYGSTELMDRIYYNLDEIGYLALVGSVDERSDFTCPICEQLEIDAGSVVFAGEDPNQEREIVTLDSRIRRLRAELYQYAKTGNPFIKGCEASDTFETSTEDAQANEIASLRSILTKLKTRLNQLTD